MVRQAVVMMLALVVAGCGARSDGPYTELEPARQAVDGLAGRQCQYIQNPQVPSAIDAVARPGTRGALLFWGRDAAPTDTVVLSVRYSDAGDLSWVRAIRSTMSAERVAELERIVGTGLEEVGPPDWGMRLLVVGGRIEAVLPTVVCKPEQGSRMGPVMQPVGTTRDMAEARQAGGRQIELLVSLDAIGRVTEVRLANHSGSRLLDQYALDLARGYNYQPKLHDGIGVPSTIQVRFRVRR
jgi:TonB family protein